MIDPWQFKPFVVSVEITRQCNLRCPFCYAGAPFEKSENPHMPLTLFYKILDDLDALEPFSVFIGGGEPFLHPNILEIIEATVSRDYSIMLSSNGTMITENLVKKIKDIGIDGGIQVSIDGLRETHDRLRGVPGTWDRAIFAVKILSQNDIATSVGTIISKENISEIPKLIEIVEEAGATVLHLMLLMPTKNFRGDEYDRLRPTPDQIAHLYAWLKEHEKDYDIDIDYGNIMFNFDKLYDVANRDDPLSKVLQPLYSGCAAGTTEIVITYNGDVIPCELFRDSEWVVGNVREQPLSEIWYHSKKLSEFRRRKQDVSALHHPCNTCEFKQLCMGGCPAASYWYYGDISYPDPLCPRVAHAEQIQAKIKKHGE